MRKFLLMCFMSAFTLIVTTAWAQDRTVTGTVTGEDGLGLPQVSVILKGTTNGVPTDVDGKYRLSVPASGGVLVFRYLGYTTQEITVGNQTTIDVKLVEDVGDLGEVVVTAFGIEKEKRALGYAVNQIDADAFEGKPQTDIALSLRGKIPGVQINETGGQLGRGTNVIIRGISSATGNNQPLYIVDGVAYDSQRFIDLDPNNIENISVLKGLAASLVYGQEGKNGVILITTKTGAISVDGPESFDIQLTQTFSNNQVLNLPDLQNTYGQGADNNVNTTFFGTWGAKMLGQVVPHHLAPVRAEFAGVTSTYSPRPNNVEDFFGNGFGSNTSVIARVSKGGTSAGFNFGRNQEEGYLKENTISKINFGASFNTEIHKGVRLNASFQYNDTDIRRPPNRTFQLLTWIPRNLDIQNLPFQDEATGANIYYRNTITNPRWSLANSAILSETSRLFAKIGLIIDIADNMTLTYNLGLDNSRSEGTFYENKGRIGGQLGFLNTSNSNVLNYDHTFLFNARGFELTPELTLDLSSGLNLRNRNFSSNGTNSSGQVVFGFLRHSNFSTQLPAGNSDVTTNVIGLWAQAELSYNDYAYLTVAGRNDWGSQLEKENRSIFYPSASLSLIPTTMFDNLQSSTLNYLKVRLGYGTSAGFPQPFNTRAQLLANAQSFVLANGTAVPTNAVSPNQPNPNLKPERSEEFELGIEAEFFNRKLSADISLYKRISEDQILRRALPASTGFNTTLINAGRLDTKGLEIGLTYDAINTGDFQWQIIGNFNAYETTVIELPEDRISINGTNFAIVGQPYGVFRSTFMMRDDEGNLLINPLDGKIIRNNNVGVDNKVVGDPNPDYTMTLINSVNYKGFSLGVQVEFTKGGDIFSTSQSNLLRRGVTKDTESLRESTHIIPGFYGDPNTGEVILGGDGNKIPNNVQISPNDLFFINLMDTGEAIVVDGTTLRIREISLGYDFPSKLMSKTPFKSANLSLLINNVWFKAFNFPKHLNVDPGILGSGVGNGQGIDNQLDPSMRKIGVNLRVNF